jgi:tetratricopeptide (TPR) repeat protein
VDVSEFVFYALTPETLGGTGVPAVPLPVRRSQVKRLMRGQQVSLVGVLEELDTYLAEHPDQEERYREVGALYAQIFGVALGRDGDLRGAGRCFEIGLARRPDHDGLRVHYAVVLEAIGMLEDALGEYHVIIDDPDVPVAPLVWMLAARALAQHGERARALSLLRECQPLMPKDASLAAMIREIEKRPRRSARRERAAPAAPSARFCTQCGAAIAPGKRFCTACGTPVKG